ncbi:GIY-YIG nuclease family protein [bacterium]|nr:GIY-YIG nuclease family protein [bacterium]MDA9360956.1 GIY-YIG nuclease family protein [Flavobacteriaceae bacterium]
MRIYYVYILECSDKTLYVGVTNNLKRRLSEHRSIRSPKAYTASRLPVVLRFYAEFSDIRVAIAKEKQIKRWSRAKKQALIDGRIDDLVNLARKKM